MQSKLSYFLLHYEVAENYVEARAPYRKEHLELATGFAEQGSLILGGALAAPIDGAMLVFRAESAATAEEFARRDPYVKAGIITRWSVRPWTVVVGSACENPVRPEQLS